MKLNKEWHLSHRMPKNPTPQQRIKWHREHLMHCDCRQPTAAIRKLLNTEENPLIQKPKVGK
ncbi:hypothetical protein A3F65_02220 [Candidatus Saccharibacteria bacterium RIFCSPHIGHO2_12_FULL_47_16b]|nr:MAG: hypothetical protein A3F65_02220 [Candidatus Saccharibacteria bacterium RIFCSPHIGHO2_12_FULL_47_16b]OGL38942.1 MAG: hypothetical protein A3J32_00265 [Candidatus Saccharibacteria bacterium RIFCSPLOWO2_02_FULL_46_7]